MPKENGMLVLNLELRPSAARQGLIFIGKSLDLGDQHQNKQMDFNNQQSWKFSQFHSLNWYRINLAIIKKLHALVQIFGLKISIFAVCCWQWVFSELYAFINLSTHSNFRKVIEILASYKK